MGFIARCGKSCSMERWPFLNLTWNLAWFGETCVELAKFKPWKRLLKTHSLCITRKHDTDYRKLKLLDNLNWQAIISHKERSELCQLKYCIDVLVPTWPRLHTAVSQTWAIADKGVVFDRVPVKRFEYACTCTWTQTMFSQFDIFIEFPSSAPRPEVYTVK